MKLWEDVTNKTLRKSIKQKKDQKGRRWAVKPKETQRRSFAIVMENNEFKKKFFDIAS